MIIIIFVGIVTAFNKEEWGDFDLVLVALRQAGI